MNACYFLVKERQVISTFVKIGFKFVSAECAGLVRRTNAAKSKS